MPVNLIKDCVEEIAEPLSYLINNCIDQSIFPTSEKIAKIKPLYKSSDSTSFTNYRPISVLPILSKVFELIVHQQLYKYLEENKLLTNFQFGYRKNRSTQQAVTLLSDHIRKHMDQGKCTGAVFLDLSKAFDTVDHGCLLSKLRIYGIQNRELNWFESYLFDRKQYVELENILSESQAVVSGVPQGSILGPLLFILLMNDIETNLEKCQIILYADDTVLFTSDINSVIIESNLNSDLVKISSWFNQNNLVINLKEGKTEYVIYGTTSKLSKLDEISINIQGKPVHRTTKYEYLGVIMDKHLNYTSHLDRMYKRASSRIKLLARIRHDLSPHVAETIYTMMISPIMFYCSNLFLGNSYTKFQKLQDRAVTIVYNSKKEHFCHSWSSIESERNRRCVVEVFKCVNNVKMSSNFSNYFVRTSHCKNTRGNNSNILIPKVRSENGRKMFAFQGAVQYNKLPMEIRNEQSFVLFKKRTALFFNL